MQLGNLGFVVLVGVVAGIGVYLAEFAPRIEITIHWHQTSEFAAKLVIVVLLVASPQLRGQLEGKKKNWPWILIGALVAGILYPSAIEEFLLGR